MSGTDKTTKIEYRKKPGFFERLGESCSGVFIGLCMFFCSFIILYSNEVSSLIYFLTIKI